MITYCLHFSSYMVFIFFKNYDTDPIFLNCKRTLTSKIKYKRAFQ